MRDQEEIAAELQALRDAGILKEEPPMSKEEYIAQVKQRMLQILQEEKRMKEGT